MSTITLELKSDLCAGTGAGYSSYVDTDISYDRYGLPCIPGRRMKGCLREAAEYYGIEPEAIDRLFGRPGSDKPGVLAIDNGYLPEADDIRRFIDTLDEKDRPSQAQVVDIFTHIHAMTAINEENGAAKPESLRFMRVLNRKKPGCDENLRFEFHCEDDGSPDTYATMRTVCQALRSIGSDRTRGLGAVRCDYRHPAAGGSADHGPIPSLAGEGPIRTLNLHIRNATPLLMTAASGDECLNYISGTALRGALAAIYLKHTPGGEPDARFNAIFYSDKMVFSNLYISDCAGGQSVPAPYYIRKLKSSDSRLDGEIISLFEDKQAFVEQRAFDGHCPDSRRSELENLTALAQEKPMRGRMLDPGTYTERPVLMERVYHHSVHGNSRTPYGADGDASLYTQTCISEGQFFRGSVTGPENLLMILKSLLERENLRLGMSRSAQYSRCEMVGDNPEIVDPAPQTGLSAGADDALVIILESDVIPTGKGEPIRSVIGEILPGDVGYEIDYRRTSVDYRMIRGYHAKRNMRSVPDRAMIMGSTVTVKLSGGGAEALKLKTPLTIGERRTEGFGRVRLASARALADESVRADPLPVGPARPDDVTAQPIGWFRDALRREQAFAAQDEGYRLFSELGSGLVSRDSSSSFIGRLMMMAEESDSWDNLAGRVSSIKNAKKKDLAANAVIRVRGKYAADFDAGKACLMTVLRLAKYGMKKKEAR